MPGWCGNGFVGVVFEYINGCVTTVWIEIVNRFSLSVALDASLTVSRLMEMLSLLRKY